MEMVLLPVSLHLYARGFSIDLMAIRWTHTEEAWFL
jgi:hypothetical protein